MVYIPLGQSCKQNASKQLTAIPKYRYPILIYLFILAIVTIYINSVHIFITQDFKSNIHLLRQIETAENYTFKKNYSQAIAIYKDILNKYPNANNIKKKISEIYFTIADKDKKLRSAGLSY